LEQQALLEYLENLALALAQKSATKKGGFDTSDSTALTDHRVKWES
jgi:hypothetical protein